MRWKDLIEDIGRILEEEESTMRKSTSSTQKKRLREKRSVLGPGISVGEMIGELATMDTLQDVLREEGVDPKEVVKIEHITTLFRSDRPFMIPHVPLGSSNTKNTEKQATIQRFQRKASGNSNKTGLGRKTLSELMLSNTWGES